MAQGLCQNVMQAQAASAAELAAVRQELQGASEVLDSMQQMASSSMEGQEQAQQQMDALTAQLQAAIQVSLATTASILVVSAVKVASCKGCRHHKAPRSAHLVVCASVMSWACRGPNAAREGRKAGVVFNPGSAFGGQHAALA